MSFATRQQALLTRLSATSKFGNTATFTHPNADKAYDRTTGKTTAGADTSLATTVLGPRGVSPRLINGTTVQESDMQITVEASRMTFTIVPGETTVTINSKVYTVTAIFPTRLNDVDVSFRLVLR